MESGRAHNVKGFRFATRAAPHQCYIKDRARNSGLTSLRFVADDRFVCCDYNEKTMHLVELNGTRLRIIASIPTIVQDGTPVQTDLLDFNGEDLLVTSNFYQGTQSLYRLHDNGLSFVGEIKTNGFLHCHGVRFVPGYRDLLWVCYDGKMNKSIVVLDYRKKTALFTLMMPEMMQDAAFIGSYALAQGRTDHIRRDRPYPGQMYTSVFLFGLPPDLHTAPPTLIDTWHGRGHMDAMKEYGGQVYSANQYTDSVDIFGISPTERIEPRGSMHGFAMPHGLDIRRDGLLAVTNYGDNTVRFLDLKPLPATGTSSG
ncbi:MAG TPA: hypothetical protein VF132_14360 [Rudaea sp.]